MKSWGFLGKWVDAKGILLNKVTQIEKDPVSHMWPLACNVYT